MVFSTFKFVQMEDNHVLTLRSRLDPVPSSLWLSDKAFVSKTYARAKSEKINGGRIVLNFLLIGSIALDHRRIRIMVLRKFTTLPEIGSLFAPLFATMVALKSFVFCSDALAIFSRFNVAVHTC